MSSGASAASFSYCRSCGKPIKSESRFCNNCGAAIGSVEQGTIATTNPAGEDLFDEALMVSLENGSSIPAMPLWQKALMLGLAPRDEVFARLTLGEGYREIVGNSGLSWQEMVEANEFSQCLIEIERAFELDRAGSLGFFLQPLNIGRLKQIDLMYVLAAKAKLEQEGIDAAVAYLASKLKVVEYLSRPPLLASLVQLGDLYRQSGAVNQAKGILNRVLETEPLYPADKERNEELLGKAREILGEIGGPFDASSGTSSAAFAQYSPSHSSAASDLSSLERAIQQQPNDEGQQTLLAIALLQDALEKCERDPDDGTPLFTSVPEIRHARKQLTRAMTLKFNDAQLRANLESTLKEVNQMESRKFVGSWLLVVLWGFFWIFPGVAFWAAFRRPRYLINRDYVDHLRAGKHISTGARIGRALGKVFDFCDNISTDWGWILGWVALVMLSPIFLILAIKENYLDVSKERI